MRIAGRCHCGNIRFQLAWSPEPGRIPARICDCSFCTRHGGVWTSCPTGALRVTVRDAGLVHAYEFGTRTARFHVCRACGVVPLVTCELDGRLHAVVNVNACEDLDPALLDRRPVTFGDEDPAARLARRRRSWIPDVAFEAG